MKEVLLDKEAMKWAKGTFSVPKGAKGWPLGRATYNACKKFGAVLISQGWTLKGEPKVSKIKVGNEDKFVPKLSKSKSSTGADIALWVPQGTPGVMRYDHPWYKPGTDQYEVAWLVSRRGRRVFAEVSDEIVKKGLPAGVKLVE